MCKIKPDVGEGQSVTGLYELFVSDSRHVFGAAVLLRNRRGRSAPSLHTDSTDWTDRELCAEN